MKELPILIIILVTIYFLIKVTVAIVKVSHKNKVKKAFEDAIHKRDKWNALNEGRKYFTILDGGLISKEHEKELIKIVSSIPDKIITIDY